MDKRRLLFQTEPIVDTRTDRQAEKESYRIWRNKFRKKIARVDLRTSSCESRARNEKNVRGAQNPKAKSERKTTAGNTYNHESVWQRLQNIKASEHSWLVTEISQ